MPHLGKKIAKAVKEKGVVAADIARYLAVTPQNFYTFQKREDVGFSFVVKIAEYLEIPLAYFYSEEDDLSAFVEEKEPSYSQKLQLANEKIEHLTQVIEEKQATIDALLKSKE